MSEHGPSVRIGGRTINRRSRPYIIAEIGVNHEGSMDQARRLVELACSGGADAVKFQSYTAETLASRDSPAYWDTTKESTASQYELFAKYSGFDHEDYESLARFCTDLGVDFLSTPFDDRAVDYLAPLVPAYKIASADLTNLPFLRRIAAKGKPVILSTGASTMEEIDLALDTLERSGCPDVVLLHCILNYPTEDHNAHLRMITGLSRSYPDHVIGYSDHTLPDDSMTALVASHLLGAVVIEKHFTHDKTLPGNDHYHAMDVDDLRKFIERVDLVHSMLGDHEEKAPIDTEEISRRNARRSIVVDRPVSAGSVLAAEDLTYKRPGTGVSPIHWDEVIGRVAARDLTVDTVLQWEDLRHAD